MSASLCSTRTILFVHASIVTIAPAKPPPFSSPVQCDALVAEGAVAASTPAEVVAKCDITFAMLADPQAALEVVFGAEGVLKGLSAGKGYVDMSTVAPETSQQISAAVTSAGGRFLEAPVSGSKGPAIAGLLILLAAGDASLYEEALPAFSAMGKRSFLLGPVGCGARIKLIVNALMGAMMASFTEALALTEAAGLKQSDLLEVCDLGAMSNPMFQLKGPSITERSYPTAFPLKHQQKDLRLALALAEQFAQSMPVTAAANEVFKAAKAAGHGDDDFSAVYEVARPVAGLKGRASTPSSTATLLALDDQARPGSEKMELQ